METGEGPGTISGVQEVIEERIILIDQGLMEDAVVHSGIGQDRMEEAAHLKTDQDRMIVEGILLGMEDPGLLEDINNHILFLNWS